MFTIVYRQRKAYKIKSHAHKSKKMTAEQLMFNQHYVNYEQLDALSLKTNLKKKNHNLKSFNDYQRVWLFPNLFNIGYQKSKMITYSIKR